MKWIQWCHCADCSHLHAVCPYFSTNHTVYVWLQSTPQANLNDEFQYSGCLLPGAPWNRGCPHIGLLPPPWYKRQHFGGIATCYYHVVGRITPLFLFSNKNCFEHVKIDPAEAHVSSWFTSSVRYDKMPGSVVRHATVSAPDHVSQPCCSVQRVPGIYWFFKMILGIMQGTP